MALCPFATQRPVSNHGGPVASWLGSVEHVTVGLTSPYPEFANSANQASSHFGILLDGELEQYVDTGMASWAQAGGNYSYMSTETVGVPSTPLTNAQLQTYGRLVAWMHTTHGHALAVVDVVGELGLITHGVGGAYWGGHTGCPGSLRSAQRPQIIALALTHLGPVPSPSVTGEDMIASTPSGNGYWICKPDGSIYSFGDANWLGAMNWPTNVLTPGDTPTGFASHPTLPGYWISTASGGVYAYGAAGYHGGP